jgi:uracil phosphoribosyltransferase
VLRDETTNLEDFINFSDRLGNLLIEFAMSFLPYKKKTITTKTGVEYQGMELNVKVKTLELLCQSHLSSCSTSLEFQYSDQVHALRSR